MAGPYIIGGTEAFVLPPSAVLAAAEADIKRWTENHDPMACIPYLIYAFDRRDVNKVCSKPGATGAAIIREALKHLERGQDSMKQNTRMLYNKPELLRAAIGEFLVSDAL